jgi:hypothetical protein
MRFLFIMLLKTMGFSETQASWKFLLIKKYVNKLTYKLVYIISLAFHPKRKCYICNNIQSDNDFFCYNCKNEIDPYVFQVFGRLFSLFRIRYSSVYLILLNVILLYFTFLFFSRDLYNNVLASTYSNSNLVIDFNSPLYLIALAPYIIAINPISIISFIILCFTYYDTEKILGIKKTFNIFIITVYTPVVFSLLFNNDIKIGAYSGLASLLFTNILFNYKNKIIKKRSIVVLVVLLIIKHSNILIFLFSISFGLLYFYIKTYFKYNLFINKLDTFLIYITLILTILCSFLTLSNLNIVNKKIIYRFSFYLKPDINITKSKINNYNENQSAINFNIKQGSFTCSKSPEEVYLKPTSFDIEFLIKENNFVKNDVKFKILAHATYNMKYYNIIQNIFEYEDENIIDTLISNLFNNPGKVTANNLFNKPPLINICGENETDDEEDEFINNFFYVSEEFNSFNKIKYLSDNSIMATRVIPFDQTITPYKTLYFIFLPVINVIDENNQETSIFTFPNILKINFHDNHPQSCKKL